MIYKHITNLPKERSLSFYTHAYYDDVLDDNMINYICEKFSKYVQPSKVVEGGEENVGGHYASYRTSDSCFIEYNQCNEYEREIFHRINNAIEICNETFFNFDLNGYSYLQYAEYNSAKLAEFSFHMDCVFGNYNPTVNLRKLSFSILLNDNFEGGQFEMNFQTEKDPSEIKLKKGAIFIFPSFIIHRVTPVTKGVRKSLVGWVLGPKFK